jgi:hypothetical protein
MPLGRTSETNLSPGKMFRISWIEAAACDDREPSHPVHSDEMPDLLAALRRASALLNAGRTQVAINRPDGSTIDGKMLLDHVKGKREIIG